MRHGIEVLDLGSVRQNETFAKLELQHLPLHWFSFLQRFLVLQQRLRRMRRIVLDQVEDVRHVPDR